MVSSNLVTELKAWMASDAGRKFACVRNYPFLDKKHDADCEGCLIVASLKALERVPSETNEKRDRYCPDCGITHCFPVEPKAHQHQWVPVSTQGQETCVSCHEYRPAVKASEQPRTPVYPDDWKKPNKVGCKNFQLRGGEYCGNCGFHASEHDNI